VSKTVSHASGAKDPDEIELQINIFSIAQHDLPRLILTLRQKIIKNWFQRWQLTDSGLASENFHLKN